MKKDFLNFILCPICKKSDFEFQSNVENDLETRDGQLLCLHCRTIFLIKEGILFFDKNINPESQKEKRVWEEERDKQKNLLSFQDAGWVLNYPFNEQFYPDSKDSRIVRLNTQNVLLFLEKINWPKETKILEIGAGSCWLTAKLAAQYKCVALDILDKFPIGLETADIFIKHRGVFFERIIADMQNLPFSDQKFDIILINAALHHSPDLMKTLREIDRILVPNGQLILLNEPSRGWLGSRERGRVLQSVEQGLNENRYTIRGWINFFKKAGFGAKIYLPFNFMEILSSRGKFLGLTSYLFKALPGFLKRIIINNFGLAVLTVFDGFFNAVIYKDKKKIFKI